MLKNSKSKSLPVLSLILSLLTVLSLVVTMPLLGCDEKIDTSTDISTNVSLTIIEQGTDNVVLEEKTVLQGKQVEISLAQAVVLTIDVSKEEAANYSWSSANTEIATVEKINNSTKTKIIPQKSGDVQIVLCKNNGEKTPYIRIFVKESCPGCKKAPIDSDYSSAVHEIGECGHYQCIEGYRSGLNHVKAPCGHYSCTENFYRTDHTKSACGHFVCDENYSKLTHEKDSCGHYICDEKTHTAAACKVSGHYVCSGEHTIRQCGKHYACDKSKVTMFCGHCECLLEEFNEKYIHEEYYCGHIMCGEKLDPAHKECEYCDQCLSYGTHSKDGCIFPE